VWIRVYREGMAVKLGSCPSCRHSIYNVEGQADACGCDEGVMATLLLREGKGQATPRPRTASMKSPTPNRNGDQLPDLDITMFMSASARAELEGARGYNTSAHVPVSRAVDEPSFWNTAATTVAGAGSGSGSGMDDFEFSSGDDIEFPMAQVDRPGRFRVDRGAPTPAPWRREVSSGPSDGQVVGRLGQQRGLPQPVRDVPGRGYDNQDARVVATTRPGTRPLTSRPSPVSHAKIPTALERLGSIEIGDDPFSLPGVERGGETRFYPPRPRTAQPTL